MMRLVLVFAILQSIYSINYKPEEGVLELNYANFNSSVAKNKILLVEFCMIFF
jgi:hypothetical protein